MCEVTSYNFKEKLPEIAQAIKDAKLLSFDMEFSSLYTNSKSTPSLFDSPSERYKKMRADIESITPIQFGLTAFTFNANENEYNGKCYNFYLLPSSFSSVNPLIVFQTNTLNFLKMNNFNFNKFAYQGLNFANKKQIEHIQDFLQNQSFDYNPILNSTVKDIESKAIQLITEWYPKAIPEDNLIIPEIYNKYSNIPEQLYLFHKRIRNRFLNLWSFIENETLVVKKVTEAQYKALNDQEKIEDEILDCIIGFGKVFDLIVSSKKPLIGHNCFYDLLVMMQNFGYGLPNNYNTFKKAIVELFPVVYDTKTLAYEMRDSIPDDKMFKNSGLSSLFDYFKNGSGRLLASTSPAIKFEGPYNEEHFHDAGWDSFCAGYVFVRFAHYYLYLKHPKSKKFVSTELIQGIAHLKNKVNVIRGSTSHIRLDGDDPDSTRPPWLVVESTRNRPVDIPLVTDLLSSYGFVEVKRLSHTKARALIAVDNFGNARRIINGFKTNPEFRIKQYNFLRHSPILKAVFLSGITLSGAMLIWFSAVKK